MTEPVLRWGFIGCGKISSDFANAMKNAKNVAFQACAARSLDSAKEFAEAHGFTRYYGSYEELCADAEVDVVYIGTLHTIHYSNSLLALRHGKHVLVEKPMAMNTKQATEVVALAKEKNLFFMEGMWTRFFPAVRHVRELLQQKAIGEIFHVNADIGFAFDKDAARIWDRALGGGGLLDVGIYPLAFVTMALGGNPERITAVGKLSEGGVDVYGSVTLEYPGNRFGTVQYSCLAEFAEVVTIIGSKGKIVINSPAHIASQVTVIDSNSSEKVSVFPHPEPHPKSTPLNFGGSYGFLYEIEAVTNAILAKQTEQSEYPPQESLEIQCIMDEVRRQLGVVYEADE
ncbi:hypothetical protein Poli38472_008167 [Pythium oligandrum]|uniref:D-xylose 1-dehydrogenase (NADP(+), D-xylono-1,5-lactone-forming) n=1 Tax=Pythium oligandrum TaxID=41045 RepID=A0A8K1CMW8_PYTOL|nr:hypothetical protein Poli38472_008167 [Pythium oligandrum]|eukprot:TMW65525.1 hypothetical protein Poli38472_008167 [Pythium oligandrum]